jgi:hypothetical protein
MSYSENIIEPDRMLIRNADGVTVLDTNRPNFAVLGNFFGTWVGPERTGPTSAVDTLHVQDHDIGAAPTGADYIFGSIRLDGATYWHEFSGSIELGSISYWNGDNAYPRVFTVMHQLAPVISSGRVVLRERWWIHGAGPAQYSGWPNDIHIFSRTWHYDLRVGTFVGGI